MAIRNIVTSEDPILSKPCRTVEKFDEKLAQLIDDMFETMYEAQGVGLAAPQVGILKRIVVIDCGDDPLLLINPEVLETSGEQTGQEGCLSVPGKAGIVTRPNYVRARFDDEQMNECEIEAEGLLARCICHELDHLDGHMYTEHVVGGLHDVKYEEEE